MRDKIGMYRDLREDGMGRIRAFLFASGLWIHIWEPLGLWESFHDSELVTLQMALRSLVLFSAERPDAEAPPVDPARLLKSIEGECKARRL